VKLHIQYMSLWIEQCSQLHSKYTMLNWIILLWFYYNSCSRYIHQHSKAGQMSTGTIDKGIIDPNCSNTFCTPTTITTVTGPQLNSSPGNTYTTYPFKAKSQNAHLRLLASVTFSCAINTLLLQRVLTSMYTCMHSK